MIYASLLHILTHMSPLPFTLPYIHNTALPCGPDKIDKIQVDQIKHYLTELNLMSYDLHGAWDALTGVNAPMFDQGWTDKSKRWSVHGCVNNYVELGEYRCTCFCVFC